MFDLVNVFQVFLPQLLLYPNPSDPLNGEAAALLMSNKQQYEDKVREYVKKYASLDIKVAQEESEDEMSDEEEQFSDVDAEPEEAADLEL